MFTKKELKQILESSVDISIKKKVVKLLNLKQIDIEYTIYIDPKGNQSKKFATAKEAEDDVIAKIGKWNFNTAKKWREYVFFDYSYGEEDSYSY